MTKKAFSFNRNRDASRDESGRFLKRLLGHRPERSSQSPPPRQSQHTQLSHSKNSSSVEVTPLDPSTLPPATAKAVPAVSEPDLTANQDSVDSNDEGDLWAIAEEKLRGDPNTRTTLQEYDRILQEEEKSQLEPTTKEERKLQAARYLESKVKELQEIKDGTRLAGCRAKIKRFLRSAADCIIEAHTVIGPATATCLPASVACAGVTLLLKVSVVNDRSVYKCLNFILVVCSSGRPTRYCISESKYRLCLSPSLCTIRNPPPRRENPARS